MNKLIRVAALLVAFQIGYEEEKCSAWQTPTEFTVTSTNATSSESAVEGASEMDGATAANTNKSAEAPATDSNSGPPTDSEKQSASPAVEDKSSPASAVQSPTPKTDTPVGSPAATEKSAEEAKPQIDPEAEKLAKNLRGLLLAEVQRNPELFGVLVVAESNPTTNLQAKITLIVDTENDTVTPESIHSIVGEKTAMELCDIVVQRYPVVEVLKRLRERIENSSDLKKCRIENVYFRGDPLVMVMQGVIERDRQRTQLTTAAAEILAETHKDNALGVPVPSTNELKLIDPPDVASLKLGLKLEAEINALVQKTGELFGSAVEVYRDPETQKDRFQISIVADVNQKQEEIPLKGVEKLITDILPGNSADPIRIVRHPAVAILQGLQEAAIRQASRVRIDGIHYVTFDASPTIQVRVVVTDDSLREQFTTLAGELLHEAYRDAEQVPAPTLVFQKLDEPDVESVKLGRDVMLSMDLLVRKAADLFGVDMKVYRNAANEKVRFAPSVIADSVGKSTQKNTPEEDKALDMIGKLLAAELPADSYDPVHVTRQPVGKVLDGLRAACSNRPALKGVRIDGIHLVGNSETGGTIAEILGQYTRYTQKTELTSLAAELLAEAYGGMSPPIPDLKGMELKRPDEQAILAWLADHIRANRALTGCKIAAATYKSKDDVISIELSGKIAHRGQRTTIQSAVLSFLSEAFGPGKVVLGSEEHLIVEWLPTDNLARLLQLELDVNDELGGCVIREARYVDEGGSEFLELVARISRPEQRAILQTTGNELVRGLYEDWTIVKVSDQTEVIPSSYALGERLFNSALNHYVRQDYETAYEVFTQVNIESPGQLRYQYWRVIAEIAVGKLDDAYHHIRPLVRHRLQRDRSYTHEYVGALYSIERVQGPIRAKLIQLEERALMHGRLTRRETASIR